MTRMRRGGALVGLWLMLNCLAMAQMAMTTVSDTVFGADGRPAQGTLLISWPAFTAEDGSAVAGGSTSVTLSKAGGLSVALTPNAGSDPMGSYYTVQYHLSDGTVTRENWVIPVSSTAVQLARVRSTVMPLSVAMQTVSKEYVDRAIANAVAASPVSAAADATIDTTAFVKATPVGAQTVVQPPNTNLNLVTSGTGATTVGGAFNLAQSVSSSFSNPGVQGPKGWVSGNVQNSIFSQPLAAYGMHLASSVESVNFNGQGYDLGNNTTSAVGWYVHSGRKLLVSDLTRGISGGYGLETTKNSIGDLQGYEAEIQSFGGAVAASDEGVTPLRIINSQIPVIPMGSCTTNCVTGSEWVHVTLSQGGPFNDGGYLLDATQGGTQTATVTDVAYSSGTGGMYADVTGVTLTPSTAWGNIIPASCTNNGSGMWQAYVSTTCNVTLGTSPASPGAFTAGQDIFLSGTFAEEARVTAVGTVTGGVQSITFSTRYAWNGSVSALVMQGGVLAGQTVSQGFIQTNGGGLSGWPVAYPVVGAFSASQLVFSNCALGACNANGGSTGLSRNIIRSGSITFYPLAEIIGTSGQPNVALLATNGIPFATGDVLGGAPAAEYHQQNSIMYGQTTAQDSSDPSVGLQLSDRGPTKAAVQLSIMDESGFAGGTAIGIAGNGVGGSGVFYNTLETLAPQDALLYVGGSSSSTPQYHVFYDKEVGGKFDFNPATNRFSLPQMDVTSDFTAATMGFGGHGIHIWSSNATPVGAVIAVVSPMTDDDLILAPKGAGAVNVSGAKITNLANGTASTDAATVGQTAQLSAANIFAAAQTVTGLPAGCVQFPCTVAKVAPAIYTGTAGTGLATIYTPSSAGEFRLCAWLNVTVAGSGGYMSYSTYFTSDGHIFYGGMAQGSPVSGHTASSDVGAGSATSNSNVCQTIYADAGTPIEWQLNPNGVTGTPSFRYALTLEQLQ